MPIYLSLPSWDAHTRADFKVSGVPERASNIARAVKDVSHIDDVLFEFILNLF